MLRFDTSLGPLSAQLYTPPVPQRHSRLLVMLHGCTQDSLDFARGTNMNAIAAQLGWFVLYPEQSRRANPQGCWQWFDPEHRTRNAGECWRIVAATRQVLAAHALDTSSTCIAGLSAGGAMAAVLATAWPELFAGVAIHSGLPPSLANSTAEALSAMRGEFAAGRAVHFEKPLIVFHGTADQIVHPANGKRLYCAAETHLHNASPSGTLRRETIQANHGRPVTLRRLLDASGRSLCEHWSVIGAGHAWSGGNPAGTYTDPFGPNASHEMARFFSAL